MSTMTTTPPGAPTSSPMQPVVEVRDLCVSFGVGKKWVPAAINLNYEVYPGEVLAIVGESGSGKSASSMALLGLSPSNARVTGSVKLKGRELCGKSQSAYRKVRGSEVAVIFQEPMTAMNPMYTIGAQIVETVRLHRDVSPAQAAERALEMLELVELPDPERAFRSYPHQLSGGQRQRAMIAQSLSCDPGLLIADEPTTALDVTVQAEILELMRNLRDKLSSAIILITHDMGVVADLSDRIAVMRHGRIVETGTSHEVFYEPAHPYTQSLLNAVPHLGRAEVPHVDVSLVDSELSETKPLLPNVPASGASAASGDVSLSDPQASQSARTSKAQKATGDVVLSLDNVAIEYPKQAGNPAFRAVTGASLQIHKGEVVGLVGESGSGKSTIGRAALGLLPIVEGTCNVVGYDITKPSRSLLAKMRKDVGMVFQDPSSSLNPRLPIGESIGEPMLLAGEAKGSDLSKRVETLLDQVGLPRAYRNRYPHELSGGQKQRVGIARALSLEPKLMVADEPTSALDVSVQATVLELLNDLQESMGFACLFITHDLAVVDSLADRIVVMRKGGIVEQGPNDQILRNPQEAYTKRLIAAVPVPDPIEQNKRRAERVRLLSLSDAEESA